MSSGYALQDEVSTAIASFTKMWQNGELENSDSATQGMLGAFLQNDPHIDTLAGEEKQLCSEASGISKPLKTFRAVTYALRFTEADQI